MNDGSTFVETRCCFSVNGRTVILYSTYTSHRQRKVSFVSRQAANNWTNRSGMLHVSPDPITPAVGHARLGQGIRETVGKVCVQLLT